MTIAWYCCIEVVVVAQRCCKMKVVVAVDIDWMLINKVSTWLDDQTSGPVPEKPGTPWVWVWCCLRYGNPNPYLWIPMTGLPWCYPDLFHALPWNFPPMTLMNSPGWILWVNWTKKPALYPLSSENILWHKYLQQLWWHISEKSEIPKPPPFCKMPFWGLGKCSSGHCGHWPIKVLNIRRIYWE